MNDKVTRRDFLRNSAAIAAATVIAVDDARSASAHHGRKGSDPADPHSSRQVRALLKYLRTQPGKTMVSGQTDMPDVEWVHEQTGFYPAIAGLEFMHYTVAGGSDFTNTQVAIDWWREKHGLVTFQWHWWSPTAIPYAGEGKTKHWAFYAKETDFDIAAVMADPNSAGYKMLVDDIDIIAGEMKKMADAGVPILFRPLHEAQGAWFWWGAKGAEPCVKLYKLMFDRIVNYHGIHNLAWVWVAYPSHQGKGDPAEWYPGDEYVDIVVSDYCEEKRDFDGLTDLTHGRKIVALAETMNAPDPDKAIADGMPWAYWVTWARRDWKPNSEADIKHAMPQPHTVTLDKLPDVSQW